MNRPVKSASLWPQVDTTTTMLRTRVSPVWTRSLDRGRPGSRGGWRAAALSATRFMYGFPGAQTREAERRLVDSELPVFETPAETSRQSIRSDSLLSGRTSFNARCDLAIVEVWIR
jgi:hypothetical protein